MTTTVTPTRPPLPIQFCFMKRLVLAALLLTAIPVFAADDLCRDYVRLGALYEVRSLMMKPYASSYDVGELIGKRLETLREGWVRWVRPEGEAPIDKHVHTVAAVEGSTPDSFEASGSHAFAVKIVVPAKRSLFNRNNAVYVGDVGVTYSVSGRSRTKTLPVNAWMNPDTSRTIDLEAIADHADAALQALVKPSDAKQAVVEFHFVQAVPRDDPANPAYDTIQALEHVRRSTDADTIDSEIATAERQLFPSADPLPLASIVADLRRANELMRSKKQDDYDKGEKLLKETMRRLR
jgi:hypothetical protein